MKKIHIYFILAMLFAGVFSCKDNDDFSTLHELTADEIAEIERQAYIADSIKNHIDADLILDYTFDVVVSASLYDGGSLPIDIAQIAAAFGISEADLLSGIAGESGAPEIKGFAIDSTTHLDYGSASTTGSPWGHWWDARGDVTEWASETDLAMTFCEFDYEAGEFYIGQFPGRLVAGQTIVVMEALKYNDIRVVVRIAINATEAGQINASVVSTQDLSISVTPKSVYDADALKFDLDKVLSDLGVGSMEDVSFIGVNADGSYNQETVTGNGFWYDFSGFVGSWGDDAAVYTNYGDFEADEVSIGQYPDHLEEGQEITIKYGFLANNKIVMLNITITVTGYVDPETAPEGDPEALVIDIELTKPYTDDYASVTADIRETLRNAFKMTTYQIHQAINSGELKLYQGEVSETEPSYTADAPGYWLKADGTIGEWAESKVWCSIGHNETDLYVYGGNHPGNAVAGDVVTTTLIATYNGGSVTINITFTITEGAPTEVEKSYDVSETFNVDFAAAYVDVTDVLTESFQLTAAEIIDAISNQTLVFEGINVDGSVYVDGEGNVAQTANYPGHWFNAEGNVTTWGESPVFYSELQNDGSGLQFALGHHPENAKVGDTTTIKQIAKLNGKQVTFTFNLTIAE
ncbi:DUF4859 domain-containing protein [uncultured Draconibacterium sp.]|uniref:DUF4859 domain-containing protein n=1 Tax=uncultured Draconibacterium sp. TaxID=1573823 RepID=UPI00321678D3